MKAAVFKERNRLVVEEVPDPRPEEDEIITGRGYVLGTITLRALGRTWKTAGVCPIKSPSP